MVKDQPLPRIEFYLRGGGFIDAVRAPYAPRQGECVNIAKQCYRVAFVQWSVDSGAPWGKELRANIELEKMAANEVGPIKQ